MSNKELLSITGGSDVNGSILNSIARILGIVLDIGRAIGSAISRYKSGNRCY